MQPSYSRYGKSLILLLSLLLSLLVLKPLLTQATNGSSQVEIHGKELYVGGRPFLVKGVNYSPWRPGTGPNKNYPYPEPEAIEPDLRLIRELNANTIRVYDPPGYVLDLAHKHGLKVLYTFYIDWWTIGSDEGTSARESILRRVEEYREKPALFGWVLGNEIPTYAIDQRGESIISGLADLYRSIKSRDNQHPIIHANWPPTQHLDLQFFDMSSFNVFPFWPPEVPAIGYANYLKQVLQPIAGDKPLLITEFGADTIQASEDEQARILKECWESIQEAGAAGGLVFEFSDEWWKNYDNPTQPGNWWGRMSAPDDEKQHDQDPEEYYGIVTHDRRPKAAFSVVADMFAAERQQVERAIPATVITLLVLLAVGTWLWAKWRVQPRYQRERHE